LLHRTLNLGILAHVDAGKTTLTERLLYAAGVIDEIGSVDDGTTQTDTLALERRRGITIKSAVASFALDDVTVNLIDTPGHPDFIAEVERVLGVLDGAVLVISAVEGVQAQTRLLMRALQRLRVPTLLFVNKTDRTGADGERVLRQVAERLAPDAIRAAGVCVEDVAERDDELLAAYVDDARAITPGQVRAALARATGSLRAHPVFFGSARTGAGIGELMRGIAELLPARTGDADAPAAGTVFKVERGATGEKVAFIRMYAGTLRARDRLPEGKVTALARFDRGGAVQAQSVSAGQIAKLWGLGEIRIGDAIGAPRANGVTVFDPPTLETVVAPRDVGDRAALHTALVQLAEQDPLIGLRQDDARHELSVSVYGEVQKEVIEATLADEYGIAVDFHETTMICIERPLSAGAAVEPIGAETNQYAATVGLRIEPAPPGSGIEFRLEVELRSVPLYVYKTVDDFASSMEAYVRASLERGLAGWRVDDCVVTMTDSGYAAPVTGAGDFRKLTPVVLMRALREGGTVVCEPIHRFLLDGPPDALRPTLRVLAHLRAEVLTTTASETSCTVEGEISAARMHLLQRELRGLTHGEGVLEFAFDRYEPLD